MKRNIKKIVEGFRKSGKITEKYDMKVSDIMTIREWCHNDYELITSSFTFGYAQGYKSALKDKRK